MGQTEIIQVLKKAKEPLTAKQIADALGVSNIRICTNISQMIKYREVRFVELDWEEAREKAGYPIYRRTRFYFL